MTLPVVFLAVAAVVGICACSNPSEFLEGDVGPTGFGIAGSEQRAVSCDATTGSLSSSVRDVEHSGHVSEVFRCGSPLRPCKVYVYELAERFNTEHVGQQVRNKSCHKTMYHPDIYMHEWLLGSQFRTTNASEADLFYVPVYATCHLFRFWRMSQTKKLLVEAVEYVQRAFPYFNASHGADHVWAFTYDFGAKLAPFEELRDSIILVIGGILGAPYFSVNKDIVIPPYIRNRSDYLRKDCSSAHVERHPLAFFRGALNLGKDDEETAPHRLYSRGLRQKMYRKFMHDPDVVIARGHSPNYICELRAAKFCLCPPGFAPWTPRVFEALLAGCVPAIISDNITFPFEDTIDYSSFTVKLAESDALNLKEVLSSIPPDVIEAKRAAGRKLLRAFSYFPVPTPGDALHRILFRLAKKSRAKRFHTFLVPPGDSGCEEA